MKKIDHIFDATPLTSGISTDRVAQARPLVDHLRGAAPTCVHYASVRACARAVCLYYV